MAIRSYRRALEALSALRIWPAGASTRRNGAAPAPVEAEAPAAASLHSRYGLVALGGGAIPERTTLP